MYFDYSISFYAKSNITSCIFTYQALTKRSFHVSKSVHSVYLKKKKNLYSVHVTNLPLFLNLFFCFLFLLFKKENEHEPGKGGGRERE